MSDNTEYIGKVKLDYSLYSGTDTYSDGDIEEELLNIVKNSTPEDYNRIICDRKDWAILYHLSPTRENIISWYPMSGAKVLEIGAGCGAITGALCRNAGMVHSIDLSSRRSRINAYRHRDADNLEIKVGNFKDIYKALDTKYDLITLIGVLEYAKAYIGGEHPYEDMLNMLKKNLAPGGKIVIAIENRLGLKYFAGCLEDHIGKPFIGINQYYDAEYGVRTFSKAELESMFGKLGFTYEFYYPYPDYKLPSVIYSDERLPRPGELNDNIRNFDNMRYVMFDETKVFDDLIKSGSFDIFSNSFLIELGVN